MSDRDPFSEIERAFDMLGEQFGVDMGAIPVDVVDEGDAFVVHADLPGYDSDDIDVQLVEDREVTISATSSREQESTDGQYVQRERRQQSLSRSVRLPEAVDDDETTASYDDGVLTVRLAKVGHSEDDNGTDIPVN
ncbi:Hsp20/alpha crystallin family protein [Haloarcula sp. KBTZ06]|uniref:Hsp20/alpha crystallin family protein n=1 Tax=Haloarcula hispanica TaxID=51589 RepID=A0A482TFX3_HALHI|nr:MULTISPECIES: Hsp20/alpha crystallin family protein [Haloarcula]AJF25851.1 heat-shock protein [Haloarcula sp. CBA1115]KAA9405512.1 Hsp20/alpha crystallin family protein [Haloarcula sp. CBA1131]KAA9408607.1 Hsp20/alpha crystallin family protein [Haloarcula hispanica]KZX50164.1 heat-shock protein [Haloarcula sp. K1]MCJ0620590.1 Hsp20/alpha crystallin family protein [Haloarcula hispanica]